MLYYSIESTNSNISIISIVVGMKKNQEIQLSIKETPTDIYKQILPNYRFLNYPTNDLYIRCDGNYFVLMCL